jgi:hypothetical protein
MVSATRTADAFIDELMVEIRRHKGSASKRSSEPWPTAG